MIKVYTLPNCIQCDMTKRFLSKQGAEFETVDLSSDPTALLLVKEWGFTSAPVVEVDDVRWAGFNPQLLEWAATQGISEGNGDQA